jgi:hypothetical protein
MAIPRFRDERGEVIPLNGISYVAIKCLADEAKSAVNNNLLQLLRDRPSRHEVGIVYALAPRAANDRELRQG